MEILYKIFPWLINVALDISIWKDIILLGLGAILPGIFNKFAKNIKDNRQNNNNKKPVIRWALLFIGLCVFLIVYIYIGQYYVKIPDVVGTDHEYAERQLASVGLKYSSFYGRDGDVVLSTSDEMYAKKGTTIELIYGRKTVSESTNDIVEDDIENIISMPDLYLLQESVAIQYLVERGWSNIELSEQYRDDIAQGYITKTEPVAGEILTHSDTITLYVSVNQFE